MLDMDFLKALMLKSKHIMIDIHTAASIGNEECVYEILKNCDRGTTVNQQNRKLWTPLMYAACCANFKVALFLLKEGGQTEFKNDKGLTALTLASKCGSTDVVNLLIDYGANVNSTDIKGWSALFYAVAYGHRSVIQLLIKRGACLYASDNIFRITPLMLAAAAGQEMIVKDLLQLGVDANAKSHAGDTAQSLAMKNGHVRIKDLIDSHSYSVKQDIFPIMEFPDLCSLLKHLELFKYYSVFESQNIDLRTFWLLTDEDLKEIGIKLLGPRKKMCMAIARYHKEKSSKAGSKAHYNFQKILVHDKL